MEEKLTSETCVDNSFINVSFSIVPYSNIPRPTEILFQERTAFQLGLSWLLLLIVTACVDELENEISVVILYVLMIDSTANSTFCTENSIVRVDRGSMLCGITDQIVQRQQWMRQARERYLDTDCLQYVDPIT